MSIDLKRYHRLYPAGLCWVDRDQIKGLVVKFKRFDNENGTEMTPEPNYFTEDELLKTKQELLDKLDALNSILEDIKNT
jgi:hypothetical protein